MRDEGYTLSNRSDMFVHVEDTIPKLKWFNMRYGDKKTFSVAWNYYLQGMRQKMIKTANKDIRIAYDKSKPSIKVKLSLDCSKAKHLFGWEPKVSLKKGIQKTIDWYKSNTLIA